MEREKKKRKKRKSVENEKTNSKESKHKDTKQKRENKVRRKTREKLRESLFFLRWFFLNRNIEIKAKEPRYFSKNNVKTKKSSKMFLKIMHEKTNSKAKIDETQEKLQFFFNDKKEYQWYFLKLLSKNKTTIYFLETQIEGW